MTQMRRWERDVTQRSPTSCPRSSHGHPRPGRVPAALRKDLHADSFKGVKYVKTVVNTNLCCTNGGGGGVVIGVTRFGMLTVYVAKRGSCMCVFVPSREHSRDVISIVTRCPPPRACLRRFLLDPPRPCMNCVLYPEPGLSSSLQCPQQLV